MEDDPLMPPQAYLILTGLAWNYTRSRQGKPTISMFARRHKAASAVVIAGTVAWLVPHLFLTAIAVAEAFDDSRPEIGEL